MMKDNELNVRAASDLLVLYWGRPEGRIKEYQVFVNDTLAAVVEQTHYTLEGLTPETEYHLKVVTVLEGTAGEKSAGSRDGIWNTPYVLETVVSTTKEKKRVDITKEPYCAIGDGVTMNTAAIQKALDDCQPEEQIYFPEGVYLTAALRLHSNTELYLEEGAVLKGTENPDDYLPRIHSRFEGYEMECYSSLLNIGILDHNAGYTTENIVLRGKGTIASGGQPLGLKIMELETARLKEYLDSLGDKIKEYEKEETISGRARPRLINISNCQNVWISGLTLKDGASWNVHMIYSDNLLTNHCVFESLGTWNGDGWDPDSSTNGTIFDCVFHTDDDGVAIKSGKNPEGNIINRPTKHIRIFDCKSLSGNGIAIGSEMSGGVSDVKVWDCDFVSSRWGIQVKGTKKRGGYVTDVHARDCKTSKILYHTVLYNDDGVGSEVPPVFANASFRNIVVDGVHAKEFDLMESYELPAVKLFGFDEPGYYLKNVELSDITIRNHAGDGRNQVFVKNCENVRMNGIVVEN
ncbi:MAG: glycoside hydrolase family 28 protein [Lachnospiraceae bacterium]|nr:glycoside hydrolase family 28 protein [Lachnospiraceae bacterium]MBP3611033.1 glycoside hydrolase family 28 protein [Lachnospiraceae bacterium]